MSVSERKGGDVFGCTIVTTTTTMMMMMVAVIKRRIKKRIKKRITRNPYIGGVVVVDAAASGPPCYCQQKRLLFPA